MPLWPQVRNALLTIAAMFLAGALAALVPALVGWWVLPVLGVLTLAVLSVVRAFGLLDRWIAKRRQPRAVNVDWP